MKQSSLVLPPLSRDLLLSLIMKLSAEFFSYQFFLKEVPCSSFSDKNVVSFNTPDVFLNFFLTLLDNASNRTFNENMIINFFVVSYFLRFANNIQWCIFLKNCKKNSLHFLKTSEKLNLQSWLNLYEAKFSVSVKHCTMRKVQFQFLNSFLFVFIKSSFWKEDWTLGHNSMKILSPKLCENSWGNSYMPCFSLIIVICFTCGGRKIW